MKKHIKELDFSSIPGREARLILNSSSELFVENHRGILEYGENLIVVASVGGSISIVGERLTAAAMNENQLLLRGRIREILLGGSDV